MTKLITWNCNMAFRTKKDRILEFDPDVLIIQECESPDVSGDWPEFTDWLWIGENEHKGLGVFSRNGLSLESADVNGQGGCYSLPVTIKELIDVLAVWAMNDEEHSEHRYIGQVYRTLQDYRDFVDSGVVVAGDFNWNVIWDESPKHPLIGNFSDTVSLLNEYGLCSVYHNYYSCEFGNEDDYTFFMHKKRDRGYHIDYIFAPERTVETITGFTVGTYEEWAEVSDHVPVMVDL